MADLPRRRALLAAASGLAAVAGCSGSDSASNSYPTVDPPLDDYELERARDGNGGALATAADALPSLSVDERANQHRQTRHVLVAESDLTELTFAETDAGQRLRSFLAATDFEVASAYLLTMPVEACREVRFRSVSVDSADLANGDLHPYADFCETYRPADTDCDTNEFHSVGFAIRLPLAADRSNGAGRSMAQSCLRGADPVVFEGTATSESGGGDA